MKVTRLSDLKMAPVLKDIMQGFPVSQANSCQRKVKNTIDVSIQFQDKLRFQS